MKRKILVLSMVVALLSALVVPMAVFAAETTEVSGTVNAPVATITAPGAVSLGTIVSHATPAQQYVGDGADGNVTVADLGGKSYEVTVTGNATKLVGTTTLTNVLQIATGNAGNELGVVATAAGYSSGTWVDPTTNVVNVTGTAQSIKSGITTTPFVLGLTAFQKIDADEVIHSGSYTLTLTYAVTVTE